jgi:DNA invertase Pin-like site-specific DNA recombinase
MNSSLHKKPSLTSGITPKATAISDIKPDQVERKQIIQDISIFSKGLTQSEIANELGVDKSTISRVLQFLKQEAKKKIERYLNGDILFE